MRRFRGTAFNTLAVPLALVMLAAIAAPTTAQAARPGPWTTTGSLNVERTRHTMTLLPDGRVLVAGGLDSGFGTLASAEIFTPGTRKRGGSRARTGNLNQNRSAHAAVLLDNGKVLVAGGRGVVTPGSGAELLSGAELFDPATGSWSLTGSMTAGRDLFQLTKLADGRVLATGGFGTDSAGAEIYDPGSGSWSPVASMALPRAEHTATLLQDGRVLVTGGNPNSPAAEIYDPQQNTWVATDNDGTVAVDAATATLLPDGKVLVAGGADVVVFRFGNLLDPTSGTNGTWTRTGDMFRARILHTATLLPDGRVLIAGGFDGDNSLDVAEVFDPATRSFSFASGPMNQARDRHTATRLNDGRVLVAGGEFAQSGVIQQVLSSAEIFAGTG